MSSVAVASGTAAVVVCIVRCLDSMSLVPVRTPWLRFSVETGGGVKAEREMRGGYRGAESGGLTQRRKDAKTREEEGGREEAAGQETRGMTWRRVISGLADGVG